MALETRARQSRGASNKAIYQMVERALADRGITGARLVDAGCGGGGLWPVVRMRFGAYCGLDAVRYEGYPAEAEFHAVDLDSPVWPIALGDADVVVAVETIEHLENPWAFMRALVAIARPGGWVVVTTPNQLSLLSIVTLIVKGRHSAFQDVDYPTHRTALLEIDLRRAATECGLESVDVLYSHSGRVPMTARHYPATLARRFPRLMSDNLLLIGRKASVPRRRRAGVREVQGDHVRPSA